MAELWTYEYGSAEEHMSSVGLGMCNRIPIIVMEVWPAGMEKILQMYCNESYCAGGIRYTGRSSMYVTSNLFRDGINSTKFKVPFCAEFWKDYRYNEDLITALKVSDLPDFTKYWSPSKWLNLPPCNEGVLGCKNQCSKSYPCTLPEQAGKECLVLVLGYFDAEPGYIQAMFANNDIPSYFCFLGCRVPGDYALDMMAQGKYALFYYYYPSDFLLRNNSHA